MPLQRLVLLAAVLFVPIAVASPTWEQIDPEAGWEPWSERRHRVAGPVRIMSKTIEGTRCFQGIAHTEVAPDALLAVITDIESVPSWSSAGVREARILARNAGTLEYYQYLVVPRWTFAHDRFWFARGSPAVFGEGLVYRWRNLVEGGPHADVWRQVRADNPGAVEPPVNVGSWYFTPDGDRTRIRYAICTDSGGSLPASLQVVATTRTLPDTVGDVITEARRRAP